MYLTIVKDTGRCCPDAKAFAPGKSGFFLSEETPPALSGLAHPFSCNPDTRDETLRHLAAFSQATVFLPALFT